jgi:hypothetical protein
MHILISSVSMNFSIFAHFFSSNISSREKLILVINSSAEFKLILFLVINLEVIFLNSINFSFSSSDNSSYNN